MSGVNPALFAALTCAPRLSSSVGGRCADGTGGKRLAAASPILAPPQRRGFLGPASATSTLRRRNPTKAGICGGGAADRRADRSRVHQTRIAATLSRRPSTTPSPSQDRPHLSSSQIRKERVEGAAHLQSGLYQRPKPPRQTLTFARTPSYHLDEPRDGANSELSWVPPGASLREHCETVYRQSLMELQRERESVRNSLFSQVHSLTSDDRLWER